MKSFLVHLLLVIGVISSSAQNGNQDKDLLSVYEAYSALPREVVYAHLNKSIYIKGETIGFTAYVLDKENNRPSLETTNLYCTLSDADGKIIKEKLVLAQQGISSNTFAIDSLFTSGEYTFKAYTNWMKNFKEPNYFVQKITVIDPDIPTDTVIKSEQTTIDAQFLPEGGHLILEANNSIGVIIKDVHGFGIPFVEGQVLDSKDNPVTTFKASEFGIGKFSLRPQTSEKYRVKLRFNGKEVFFPIESIESQGIGMVLHDLHNKVALEFNTNSASLPNLKGKTFSLAIHNGKKIKVLDIVFNEKTQLIKAIPYQDLTPGINIFTLFDQRNNPILERQFFNYDGLSLAHSESAAVRTIADSLSIKLKYDTLDPAVFNRLSVSVLPAETQSYGHHHNFISYTLLQPYVKGYIENASYYFTDITPRKKYELDNLLLTQGWSSYTWTSIFNNPPDYTHDFEKGISFSTTVNNLDKRFFLYPNAYTSSEFIDVAEGENSFQKKGMFPFRDEKIRIGAIDKKSQVKKPQVYLQFKPRQIPELTLTRTLFGNAPKRILQATESVALQPESFKEIEVLDEVVLTHKKENTRIERLKNRAAGRVEVFDDRSRLQYRYLSNYLSQKGFAVSESGLGVVSIANRNPLTPNNVIPTIYLDDVLLSDFDILYRYTLDVVDYIEINRSGLGGGLRGGGGIIKIYTDPILAQKNKVFEGTYSAFDIPLTFEAQKKYYVPQYNSFTTNFFRDYGVIDWLPQLQLDANKNIDFRIFNTGTKHIRLFIEGITNNGIFVSEVKEIQFD